ncbi:MAG TPA: lysophospholipid acyltransferase family protein [Puia sp.]|nr:lysophospholipid acyltransferase family protein [Puia sp.]
MKPGKILNWLALPLLYFISLLPFPLLYLLSDFLFVFIFYIWRYRKKIVYDNLRNSFPDASDAEIKALRWFYYRYLSDLFLETIKMLTISSREMIRRCDLDGQSRKLLDQLYEEGESAILTLGHKGNWEWAGLSFSLLCKQSFYIVYHPLSNSVLDKVMLQMRSRFGARLTTMNNAFKTLKQAGEEPVISAFVADQSPPPATALWTEFLHRETPFFRGPEKISSKLGQNVVYLSINRIRRGYYIMHVDKLVDSREEYVPGRVTEKYVDALEKDILSNPATWLWSHRRWKHKKPELAA